MPNQQLVLVLGATGYVGGRLVPRLLEAGYRVRCLVRTPGKLAGRPWSGEVEVVEGDLHRPSTLREAFAGVHAVYHLVHAPGPTGGSTSADRRSARNVAAAAAEARVRRIIHLGGRGGDDRTPAQQRGRGSVAALLAAGPVPVSVLRAAVIIGSGSASFEVLRHLVERLPVMVAPRWVGTRVQPIAIRDVLRYLVGVLDQDDGLDHDYDLGGPDVLTYREMMAGYARVAGLTPPVMVPVPVLAPALSAWWIHLVTPVPAGIARRLVSRLGSDVVVRPTSEDIASVVPGPCRSYAESLRLALARTRDGEVPTSWREAEIIGRGPVPSPGDPARLGGTLLRDEQQVHVAAPAGAVFASVSRVGGGRGWPTHRWAWQVRGLLDRLIGGVGLHRGRRDPIHLRVGDAVDFWRVEVLRPPGAAAGAEAGAGLLRLRAEMRLPGRAWLEWRMTPSPDRPGTELRQRALFAPRGILGRLYWWAMLPFHGLIFRSMVEALAADAVEMAAGAIPSPVTSAGAPTAPPGAPDAPDGGPGPEPPPARRAG